MTKIFQFKTASHLKYNRLRAVGHFFDAGIRAYVKEKNVRMCVILLYFRLMGLPFQKVCVAERKRISV